MELIRVNLYRQQTHKPDRLWVIDYPKCYVEKKFMKHSVKINNTRYAVCLSILGFLSTTTLAAEAEKQGPPPSPVKIEMVKSLDEVPSAT